MQAKSRGVVPSDCQALSDIADLATVVLKQEGFLAAYSEAAVAKLDTWAVARVTDKQPTYTQHSSSPRLASLLDIATYTSAHQPHATTVTAADATTAAAQADSDVAADFHTSEQDQALHDARLRQSYQDMACVHPPDKVK